jgi:hypothetical protein
MIGDNHPDDVLHESDLMRAIHASSPSITSEMIAEFEAFRFD